MYAVRNSSGKVVARFKTRAEAEACVRRTAKSPNAGAHVFPPGAKVYVDGQHVMRVLQAFPEGSTSYLFPHYTLGPAHRRILNTNEVEVVAMNRVGVVKKKPRWGGPISAEEKRWLAEYDAKHPLGTMEEARMVAERTSRGNPPSRPRSPTSAERRFQTALREGLAGGIPFERMGLRAIAEDYGLTIAQAKLVREKLRHQHNVWFAKTWAKSPILRGAARQRLLKIPKHLRILSTTIVLGLQRDNYLDTPFQIAQRYGLSVIQGRAILDVATGAFGPGGHGEAWAVAKVAGILKTSSRETR